MDKTDPRYWKETDSLVRGAYAAPPKPQGTPGAFIENVRRPTDSFANEIGEAISPTMGAYGMGQIAGDTAMRASDGDYSGAAMNLPMLAMAFAPGGAKAKAMKGGFDTGTTVYRGLRHPYSQDEAAKMYYQMFTHSKDDASDYAMSSYGMGKPNVMPAHLRRGRNLEVDAGRSNFNTVSTDGLPETIKARLGPTARTDEIAHAAREAGYDSLTVKNVFDNPSNERQGRPTTIEAVFDPSNIRSPWDD